MSEYEELLAAAQRVIAAFRSYGCASGVTNNLMTRQECERSMEALAHLVDEPEPRYTLTDLGNAYRAAMQSGAKLNGEVKAGED